MNKEEIIEMAQRCGLFGIRPYPDGTYSEALEDFAKIIAKKEREECAKLVESSIYDWKIDATNPHEWDELAIDLANVIVNQTRGQE